MQWKLKRMSTTVDDTNKGGGNAPDYALEAYQEEIAASVSAAEGVSTKNNSYQVKWNTNLQNLKTYKEKHGHTNVSRTDDKVLGRWVNNQRQAYRCLLEGKQSSLTAARIHELEKVCVSTLCMLYHMRFIIIYCSIMFHFLR